MAYDGIVGTTNTTNFNLPFLYAKVVDNVLNHPTYLNRLMSQAKPFVGKTMDYTIKVTSSGQGQWFTGMEPLNTSPTYTTAQLSFAHTAIEQPIAIPLVDAVANTGAQAVIPLYAYKLEEAEAELRVNIGTALYQLGTAGNKQMNGLYNLVDDGTISATIGGLSRATYPTLKGTVIPAPLGTLSLALLAQLEDAIKAAGLDTEQATVGVTTKTVWSLFEQLLQPQIRHNYMGLPVRGGIMLDREEYLKRAEPSFQAISYRGIPFIADDFAPTGVLWFVNERYMNYHGRTTVPDGFRDDLVKISLNGGKASEGVMAAPGGDYGWYFQKTRMLPNQAGIVGHIYQFGQLCTDQPRRHGRIDGITKI